MEIIDESLLFPFRRAVMREVLKLPIVTIMRNRFTLYKVILKMKGGIICLKK